MRYAYILILCVLPLCTTAQEWEDRQVFEGQGATRTLRVISSTDLFYFEPIISSFLARNPETSVEYLVTGTSEISTIVQADPDQYDLVVSSAMDLQFKLANDGYALEIPGMGQPEWAHWHHSLFAFTTEPAAIVINRAAFAGRDLPRTRQALIQALRSRPDFFRNRIGTYDVRRSGVGYLFATQDARVSETYWRLMEVMGSLNVRLYCCSGEMIDDVANGTIAVAYNVLGSYASARIDDQDSIEVILPSDFPTTMMRTVFVSKSTAHPETAVAFVRHLVELQSGKLGNNNTSLPPLTTDLDSAPSSVIAIEPALLTYLDRLKRQTFIDEWESAIIQ